MKVINTERKIAKNNQNEFKKFRTKTHKYNKKYPEISLGTNNLNILAKPLLLC